MPSLYFIIKLFSNQNCEIVMSTPKYHQIHDIYSWKYHSAVSQFKRIIQLDYSALCKIEVENSE